MPGYKQKAVKILNKFGFTMSAGHRHDKYIKNVISSDQQKHKIVTNVERHNTFPEYKFDTIMKQISLSSNNIESALRCPYKKQDYENDISCLTKDTLRRWGKQ
jgi:hypothetical protein